MLSVSKNYRPGDLTALLNGDYQEEEPVYSVTENKKEESSHEISEIDTDNANQNVEVEEESSSKAADSIEFNLESSDLRVDRPVICVRNLGSHISHSELKKKLQQLLGARSSNISDIQGGTGSAEVHFKSSKVAREALVILISASRQDRTLKERTLIFLEDQLCRTLFVGNVPVDTILKDFKKFLRQLLGDQLGPGIESVRFRSIPVSTLDMPRKIAISQKKLNSNRKSMNAYVVFESSKMLSEALELLSSLESSAKIFCEHHLRFDSAKVTNYSKLEKKDLQSRDQLSVFVGNLPFDIEEEELYQFFENCGSVEDVRVIRDKKTNAGKGFAYVRFSKVSEVKNALSYNDTFLKNRKIRVSKSDFTHQLSSNAKQGAVKRLSSKKRNSESFSGAKASKTDSSKVSSEIKRRRRSSKSKK